MIKSIALSFGAFEDNYISWVIFCSDTKYKTEKEALKSLASFLYKKFKDDRRPWEDKKAACCRRALAGNSNLERCPRCDAKLQLAEDEDDILAEWVNWLRSLPQMTTSEYPPDGDEYNWDVFSFDFSINRKNMIVINENAEIVLLNALTEKNAK